MLSDVFEKLFSSLSGTESALSMFQTTIFAAEFGQTVRTVCHKTFK